MRWVADIHRDGEPFVRVWVDGPDEAAALAAADGLRDDDREEAAAVVPWDDIHQRWAGRVRDGHRVTCSFKHEDEIGRHPFGPVVLCDLDEADADPLASAAGAIPFGYRPAWEERLPWLSLPAARLLAKSLNLPLEES